MRVVASCKAEDVFRRAEDLIFERRASSPRNLPSRTRKPKRDRERETHTPDTHVSGTRGGPAGRVVAVLRRVVDNAAFAPTMREDEKEEGGGRGCERRSEQGAGEVPRKFELDGLAFRPLC